MEGGVGRGEVRPVEAELARGDVVEAAPGASQQHAGAVRVAAAVMLQRDGELDEALEQHHGAVVRPAAPHRLELLVGVEVRPGPAARQVAGEGSASGGRVAASIGNGSIDVPRRVHAITRLPVDRPRGWPIATRAPWLTPGA